MIIIKPHCDKNSGGGIFISKIYECINNKDIIFCGSYANNYSIINDPIFLVNFFDDIIFPNYFGVSIFHKIYFILLILIYTLKGFICNKFKRNFDNNLIIFTSSIQIFQIYFYKVFFPRYKFIIFIQENLILTGFFGPIIKITLHKYDAIISITESWRKYAESYGISSFLQKNIINLDAEFKFNNSDKSEIYDLLFVGGCQKIKGFPLVINAYSKISSEISINLCILGGLDKKSTDKINKLNSLSQNNSKISYFNFVNDIKPYLLKSKILLLPIASPHFCRPAIEAGLLNKTFIVSNLPGLEDFAIDKFNCITYIDEKDFVKQILLILSDEKLRNYYSYNNNKFSLEYSKTNSNNILPIIDMILNE